MAVSHVIFDLDGTLVDSESLFLEAIDSLCLQFSVCGEQKVKTRLLGHPFKDRVQQLYSELNFKTKLSFEEFMTSLLIECRSRAHTLQLMEGIESFVKKLRDKGLEIAICSGNDFKSFEETKQRFQSLFSHFSLVILGGEEKVRGKPFPDLFEICFQRFKTKPKDFQNVLVIEDSKVGIEAAVSARMKSIQILNKKFTAEVSELADSTVNSFEEINIDSF